MTRAGWAASAAAALALLAGEAAAAPVTATEGGDGPVAAWVVRGVAGLPTQFRNLLTETARPVWYTVPRGRTKSLGEILDERCGDQPAAARKLLEDRILELNGAKKISFLAAPGKVVATPFCLNLERNVTVKVQKGDNPSKILAREYGIAGPKTLAAFYELNKDGRHIASYEDFVERLPEGEDVVVPYAAAKQYYVPKMVGAESPESMLARYHALPAALRPDVAITFASNVRPAADAASPPAPQLAYVPSASLTGGVTCRTTDPSAVARIADMGVLRARYEAATAARDKLYGKPERPTIVGIVDSGLHAVGDGFFHKSLMRVNRRELTPPDNDEDNDHNNYKDDVYGMNLFSRTGRITPHRGDPKENHGTVMASLVLGGPDIASGWTATMTPPPLQLKIVNFSDGPPNYGLLDPTVLPYAVRYLIDQEADIVNMSLATREDVVVFNTTYDNHQSKLFVVAAGNNETGEGVNIAHNAVFPALHGGVANRHVITVGAHDLSGQRASFSNYSYEYVDLLAPGCAVPARATGGRLVRDSGTSPATAIVSFTAALIHSLGLTSSEAIKVRILAGTDYDPGLSDAVRTSGRLNIVKAISLYHDAVETETPWPAGGTETLIFGRIMDAEKLFAFCTDPAGAPRAKTVRKVLPNLKDGDHKKIEFWTEVRGRFSREFKCRQQNDDASIGRIVVNGQEMDGPAIKDVRDITMGTLTPAD